MNPYRDSVVPLPLMKSPRASLLDRTLSRVSRLLDLLFPLWCSGCYQPVPREFAGWTWTQNYGDLRNVAYETPRNWCWACMEEVRHLRVSR
jgi:hypothetical protein